MKKIIGLLVAMAALALVTGCASAQKNVAKQTKKEMKNLSFQNEPNGLLELHNETSYDLVIFCGNVSNGYILGGIHGNSVRSFDYSKFATKDNGAFLIRAVKKDVYEAKAGFVDDKRDVIFAQIVTYDGKIATSRRITGEVGGGATLLFENMSPYPVELRLGYTGQVISTLPPYCKEQYIDVAFNSRGYVIYPTYLLYDKANGKMSSIAAKEDEGIAVRPARENERPVTSYVPMPNSKLYGHRVAYLTVRNETRNAFIFENGRTELTSQNGYSMINSGETLTFEVDCPMLSQTYRSLTADFRVGTEENRFIPFFNGEPVELKAGTEYLVTVYNDHGLVKTVIDDTSERPIDFSLAAQFDFE